MPHPLGWVMEISSSHLGSIWCSLYSGKVSMNLLTYLFAAALLWAVAATGPTTPNTSVDPAPRAEASDRAAPVSAVTYRR